MYHGQGHNFNNPYELRVFNNFLSLEFVEILSISSFIFFWVQVSILLAITLLGF